MDSIVWSLGALDDLAEIGLFIERDSSHYAEVVVNRLYSSVDRLALHPLSGREVPELHIPSVREVIVEGYRLIYETRNNSVENLAVVNSRQNLRKRLSRD